MKYLRFETAILALFLFSCSSNSEHKEPPVKIKTTKILKSPEISNDKQEIQNLIRKVLNWKEAKKFI